MESISEVLTVAIFFAVIYGLIRLHVQRNERLLMIEKDSNLPDMKHEISSFSGLKFGIFFFGIELGVLIAYILTATINLEKEVAYFSMVFLFGGISLIIAHLVERKKDKKYGLFEYI